MNSAALVLKEVEISTEISLVYARKDNFNSKRKHFENLQLLQTVEMKHSVLFHHQTEFSTLSAGH